MDEPRDDRVSAAYRELPGEGPPPALDAAIQAAARRAVGSKPAAGRRWQKPLSIAAVFMLAIAVTLQVERHKPVVEDGAPVSAGSAEYPVPQQQAAPAGEVPPPPASPAPKAAPAQAPARAPSPVPAPAPSPLAKEAFVPEPPMRAEPAPASAPPPPWVAAPPPSFAAPAAPPAPVAMDRAASGATTDAMRVAPQAARRAKAELAREATTQEKKMAEAMETPERRLERIADLRAKGLHDEADRELEAFRRDLPGYRIGEEWLRKVERR